jgi:hypothetical protein
MVRFFGTPRHLAIAASTGGETEVLTKTLDQNLNSKDGNPFIF